MLRQPAQLERRQASHIDLLLPPGASERNRIDPFVRHDGVGLCDLGKRSREWSYHWVEKRRLALPLDDRGRKQFTEEAIHRRRAAGESGAPQLDGQGPEYPVFRERSEKLHVMVLGQELQASLTMVEVPASPPPFEMSVVAHSILADPSAHAPGEFPTTSRP